MALFAQRFQHLWKRAPFSSGLGAGKLAVPVTGKPTTAGGSRQGARGGSAAPDLTGTRRCSYTRFFVNGRHARAPPGACRRSAREASQHEADVSAEQSQAQEDPRLSGSDAHQGRPSRPQAAPTEGSQARRHEVGRFGGPDRGQPAAVRAPASPLRVPTSLPARLPARRPAVPARGAPERPRVEPTRPHRRPQGRGRERAQSCQTPASRSVSAQQAPLRPSPRPGDRRARRDEGQELRRGRA